MECHLLFGISNPAFIGISASHKGAGIQEAIRSATITQVNFEGREIFIKNKSEDAFRKVFDIEDLPQPKAKEIKE